MKHIHRLLAVFISSFALFLLSGCGDKEPAIRQYTEITTPRPAQQTEAPTVAAPAEPAKPAPAPPMKDSVVPVANGPLSWDVPEGWKSKPASGMRLGTLFPGEEGLECAITSFPGKVGGRFANVQRWAGMVGGKSDEASLKAYLAKQEEIKTTGGFTALVLDFSDLLEAPADDTPSMLAAIIELPDSVAFFKIQGKHGDLQKHKETFGRLVKTVRSEKAAE
jgi:hypothetical protein